MSKRVEAILKSYPEMVQKRNCLAYQIAHFKGLSAEEVIESMYTPRQDGERVQTSTISDKTAQIAMVYQERRERMNREWYEYLEHQLRLVNDEVAFLEAAIQALPPKISEVMCDLVFEQNTWDAVQSKRHIGRATLSAYRRKAIQFLDTLYADRTELEGAFLLQ